MPLKSLKWLFYIGIVALLGACAPVPQQPVAGWSFAVFGDTPYTAAESAKLDQMIQDINRSDVAFVIHVGDIKGSGEPCTNALFDQRRAQLQQLRHPWVLVYGDNEWTDCHRRNAGGHDPVERLARLRVVFSEGAESFGPRAFRLERQSDAPGPHAQYRENVRWQREGILFVGLNVPGSNNNFGRTPDMDREHAARMAANDAWLAQAVAMATAPQVKALVIAMQADPDFEAKYRLPAGVGDGYAALRRTLAAHARALAKPVLLVHGDSHEYIVDQPLKPDGKTLENFTRLEVPGSPQVNWVKVTPAPGSRHGFVFQRGPALAAGN